MKRYALLLAADRYRDPGIQPLRYAERDARVLEGFLRESASFDRVEEFYGEALTKNAALDAAEHLADELAGAGGGLLLLFYAGHGFTHLNRHCLLTPGARLRDLDEFDHAVTVDRLKRVTARPRVERQLVVDACRSNLRVGERQLTEGYSATGLRNVVGAAPEPQAGGWSVLASCDEGEQASEVETLRHGVFAWAWLEELRTAQKHGREVRLDERLVERLRTRVAELGRQYGLDRSQRPWVQSNAIPPLILGGTPGAIRPAFSLAIPAEEPAPAPAAGGSVLLRLREEAQRRAAAVARRREIFDELYPAYEELRRDRHTRPEDLADAWADLCASCGVAVVPATPGDLEWHEDTVRVVTLPTNSLARLTANEATDLIGTLAAQWSVTPSASTTAASSTTTPPRAMECADWPFENSLGMKFVPVMASLDGQKSVLFSIWPTRVQDYAAYAATNASVNEEWKDPLWGGQPVTPGPTHPVVNVSWEDAKGFCAWLTAKEQREGKIGPQQSYRLPTDAEWSWAVGIGEAEESAGKRRSPMEKDGKIGAGTHPWAYPWGQDWPPPKAAGNYGSELKVDEYDRASPVGSFGANPQGLYDLGGNVWEWVEDYYDGKSGARVARGASFSYGGDRNFLLSAYRLHYSADSRNTIIGFRLVLVGAGA
jgi:hypothetical protein